MPQNIIRVFLGRLFVALKRAGVSEKKSVLF